MMAILTQPNRSPALHRLQVPTLVVHGLADQMVHVSGGRATAAAIPGAELLLVEGMGHDLPPELYETLVDADRPHRRPGLSPAQSESRSPVSVSKTCTWRGSVVTWIRSPCLTVPRAVTRTITWAGVPSTSQVP